MSKDKQKQRRPSDGQALNPEQLHRIKGGNGSTGSPPPPPPVTGQEDIVIQ